MEPNKQTCRPTVTRPTQDWMCCPRSTTWNFAKTSSAVYTRTVSHPAVTMYRFAALFETHSRDSVMVFVFKVLSGRRPSNKESFGPQPTGETSLLKLIQVQVRLLRIPLLYYSQWIPNRPTCKSCVCHQQKNQLCTSKRFVFKFPIPVFIMTVSTKLTIVIDLSFFYKLLIITIKFRY